MLDCDVDGKPDIGHCLIVYKYMQPGLVTLNNHNHQTRNEHGILFNGNAGLPGGAGGDDWLCIL
jgi:uncharacterized cupin superfamily protein